MIEPPAIAAARRFIALATEGQPPGPAELSCALDELVVAVHALPRAEPDDPDADAPPPDQFALREQIAARFPNFGFYGVADPLAVPAGDALLGDAIDDLVDIVLDLREALWGFDNLGPNDGVWSLRFLFGAHWGRHARELSLYLHALQFG